MDTLRIAQRYPKDTEGHPKDTLRIPQQHPKDTRRSPEGYPKDSPTITQRYKKRPTGESQDSKTAAPTPRPSQSDFAKVAKQVREWLFRFDGAEKPFEFLEQA